MKDITFPLGKDQTTAFIARVQKFIDAEDAYLEQLVPNQIMRTMAIATMLQASAEILKSHVHEIVEELAKEEHSDE